MIYVEFLWIFLLGLLGLLLGMLGEAIYNYIKGESNEQ